MNDQGKNFKLKKKDQNIYKKGRLHQTIPINCKIDATNNSIDLRFSPIEFSMLYYFMGYKYGL